jgi:methionyl-tRNA formyltransferase
VRHVFLGTSAFAAAVLERLTAAGLGPALVVSRPDRPAGRGRRLSSPPVVETARKLGLDSFQPADLHDAEARARISAAEPAALTVCAYGVLIKEPLLSAYEVLNVHPSLLPRWRGAAPIERAIMAGDAVTGVSIMRLVEALDAGPVCLQESEPIRSDDDAGSLGERLQVLGGELLRRALVQRPPFREQPEVGVTYAEKIESRDRLIDHENPVAVEERRVRALNPHIGARLDLPDDTTLGVRAARAGGPATDSGWLRVDDGRLLLDCRDGALELLEVQPAGGRPMPAPAWLTGRVGAALAQSPLRLPAPPRP